MQVFKFGGASVKDAAAVKNVASILQKHAGSETVVVVSAMGKITNKLEELARAYFSRSAQTGQILNEVRSFHEQIMHGLFNDPSDKVFDTIGNCFVELQWALEDEPSHEFDHHYDQIVSFGEILSSQIISAFLNFSGLKNEWIDIRGVIQTDNTYREGRVDLELSGELAESVLLPALKRSPLLVTQGFLGGTSENFTTTLGREGSDYTAALLAYFLNAARVVIWKDVPGVLNADPKFFRNTKKIDELNYQDATELTYYGASVIHPKTIKPLQNKNIPLVVRSFADPADEGTLIRDSDNRISVTSYIFKENQILISIQPRDFSFIGEDNLSDIFGVFSRANMHIHMMQISALSFSVCCDHDPERTTRVINDLQENFRVLYNTDVQLMTVRNYDQDIISKLTADKTVLLEQRSRYTCQMVLKAEAAAG